MTKNIHIKYESKDELMKLISKLTSLIQKEELSNEFYLSNEDLDLIHLMNTFYKGRTECGLKIEPGIRVQRVLEKSKITCPKCLKFFEVK